MGGGIPQVLEEEGFLGSAPRLEDEEGGDDGEEGEVRLLRKWPGHGSWVRVAVQGTLVL